MKYNVTYYDFDRNDNTMKDGHHMDVEAQDAIEAVNNALRWLSDNSYDYQSVTEATAEDENGTMATAYRTDADEWELHTYSPSGDELSFRALTV